MRRQHPAPCAGSGVGVTADGPIVTTPGFISAGADFCSDLSAGATAGRDYAFARTTATEQRPWRLVGAQGTRAGWVTWPG